MRTFKAKRCGDCSKDFTPRSASHVRCDPCAKAKKQAYNAAYRAKNHEYLLAADRARYTKDQIAEKGRQYRERNDAEVRARKKAYYEANRERIITHEAERYATDAERIQQVQREWREKNPEALRSRHARRRARKAGVESLPYRALDIFERDNWTCRICDRPVDPTLSWPDSDTPSLDHIVPLAAGGPDVPENIQTAHLRCNLRKGRKILAETAV